MKGDDVLAFDFRGKKPQIIIGEVKFRGVPSKAAVEDIIKGLNSSYDRGRALVKSGVWQIMRHSAVALAKNRKKVHFI